MRGLSVLAVGLLLVALNIPIGWLVVLAAAGVLSRQAPAFRWVLLAAVVGLFTGVGSSLDGRPQVVLNASVFLLADLAVCVGILQVVARDSRLATHARRLLWALPLASTLMLVTWWPTQGEITTVPNGVSILVGFTTYVATGLLLLGLLVVTDHALRVRQDVDRFRRRSATALS